MTRNMNNRQSTYSRAHATEASPGSAQWRFSPDLEGENLSKYVWYRLSQVLRSATSFYEEPHRRKPASKEQTNERIREHLLARRAALVRPDTPGAEITEDEVEWIVYTVALAILNPIKAVDFDTQRVADRVRNRRQVSDDEDEYLEVFSPPPALDPNEKQIRHPALILDAFGGIAVWHLPDILSSARVKEVNSATEGVNRLMDLALHKAQLKARRSKNQKFNWRLDPENFRASDMPRFIPGSIELSPGWFAQAHERYADAIVPSTNLRKRSARSWLKRMHSSNVLFNIILALTHKRLYLAGSDAILRIKRADELKIRIKTHKHVSLWNSVFTGFGVIANRITPSHRDVGGPWCGYDLLFSAGTHRKAYLRLDDFGTEVSYDVGTVDLLCGKVLRHSVPEWAGGERICIAGFMRDAVHSRLGVRHVELPSYGSYTHLMNNVFAFEQGWSRKRIYGLV